MLHKLSFRFWQYDGLHTYGRLLKKIVGDVYCNYSEDSKDNTNNTATTKYKQYCNNKTILQEQNAKQLFCHNTSTRTPGARSPAESTLR